MSAGQVVTAPDGTEITLVGIGSSEVIDTQHVRVWDVSLAPGAVHSWHLHHNPYVVLSIAGGNGRMDWLDGSEPRFISEYTGGAVFRPVSPVHRLTNIGDTSYRNRLVELKGLGELCPDGPLDVGHGVRSSIDDERTQLSDGRLLLLVTPYVTISTVVVPAGGAVQLKLTDVPHVLARIDDAAEGPEIGAGLREVAPGRINLAAANQEETWFIVGLDYLGDPQHLLVNDSEAL